MLASLIVVVVLTGKILAILNNNTSISHEKTNVIPASHSWYFIQY